VHDAAVTVQRAVGWPWHVLRVPLSTAVPRARKKGRVTRGNDCRTMLYPRDAPRILPEYLGHFCINTGPDSLWRGKRAKSARPLVARANAFLDGLYIGKTTFPWKQADYLSRAFLGHQFNRVFVQAHPEQSGMSRGPQVRMLSRCTLQFELYKIIL